MFVQNAVRICVAQWSLVWSLHCGAVAGPSQSVGELIETKSRDSGASKIILSHINVTHLYVHRHMNGLLQPAWFNSKTQTRFHESTRKLVNVRASSPAIPQLLLFCFQASSPQTDSVHSWDTQTGRRAVSRLLVPSPWITIHKHAWSCGFHHCRGHKQAADLLPHARQKVAGKHKQLRSQPVKPTAKLVPHPFYVWMYDVCVEINWEHCHKASTDTHIQEFWLCQSAAKLKTDVSEMTDIKRGCFVDIFSKLWDHMTDLGRSTAKIVCLLYLTDELQLYGHTAESRRPSDIQLWMTLFQD